MNDRVFRFLTFVTFLFINIDVSANYYAIPSLNSDPNLYWLNMDGNIKIVNIQNGTQAEFQAFEKDCFKKKRPVALAYPQILAIKASKDLSKLFIVYSCDGRPLQATLWNVKTGERIFDKKISSQMQYYTMICDMDKNIYKLVLLSTTVNFEKIEVEDDDTPIMLNTLVIYDLLKSKVDFKQNICDDLQQNSNLYIHYYGNFRLDVIHNRQNKKIVFLRNPTLYEADESCIVIPVIFINRDFNQTKPSPVIIKKKKDYNNMVLCYFIMDTFEDFISSDNHILLSSGNRFFIMSKSLGIVKEVSDYLPFKTFGISNDGISALAYCMEPDANVDKTSLNWSKIKIYKRDEKALSTQELNSKMIGEYNPRLSATYVVLTKLINAQEKINNFSSDEITKKYPDCFPINLSDFLSLYFPTELHFSYCKVDNQGNIIIVYDEGYGVLKYDILQGRYKPLYFKKICDIRFFPF